ncbi:chromatin target of PRMT1 protein-like [Clytia hemisphaerica]|uniref:Chromatin target of PRMT1 protein C-terminal domain-containing protein n=1 Tax=Clytia hemisphaerica TaxID=252671 RepID=A0A7M5WVT4_9CNID|eukprot:TCONS_00066538-protein
MALAPVKVVLKSTTTKTLNDRFTELMRNKAPARQEAREDSRTTQRASAKNRRLAEQMSRRTGIGGSSKVPSSAAMDKESRSPRKGNIRNRIDRSKIKSNVKDRLGSGNNNRGGSSIQNRLGQRGGTRGRGGQTRGGRGGGRGVLSRIGGRAGKTSTTSQNDRRQSGGNSGTRGRGGRGRGRGGRVAGGRGGGRGRGRKGAPNADALDNEIDSYMTGSKS